MCHLATPISQIKQTIRNVSRSMMTNSQFLIILLQYPEKITIYPCNHSLANYVLLLTYPDYPTSHINSCQLSYFPDISSVMRHFSHSYYLISCLPLLLTNSAQILPLQYSSLFYSKRAALVVTIWVARLKTHSAGHDHVFRPRESGTRNVQSLESDCSDAPL